jgi:ribosome-binding protein aMBF1 (putative translation factor)
MFMKYPSEMMSSAETDFTHTGFRCSSVLDAMSARTPSAAMVKRIYGLAEEIGDRLRSSRLAAGLTIRELARASHMDKNSVSDLELGRIRNPGVGTIADLAKALGVDPRWLAFGYPHPSDDDKNK